MQVSPSRSNLPADGCQDGLDLDRLEAIRSVITPAAEADELADLFKLLGEPNRLRILSTLMEAGELNVSSIAEVVGAGETKTSQALSLLRTAGVVKNRRVGRTIFYRLDDAHVRLILGLSLKHVDQTAEKRRTLIGEVDSISLAEANGAPLSPQDQVEALTGVGLEGDRHAGNPARQVTIQSRTELAKASKRLGREILAEQTRRNITIESGLLPRTRGQRLLIGETELEVFSDAPPCALMTELIGEGARPALKKLAGIHCRVIKGGAIRVGDELLLGRPA